MYGEVDSTNLESIKANRQKVASPRFGGQTSARMINPKKTKKKVPKKTLVK